MEYGYARVSTKEQNETRQLLALNEYGIPRKKSILISSLEKTLNAANIRN